ncbi:MAG: hypothetical protein JJE30_11260 [Desulfuromonadales bacterium]|nr:hypothetical protein [Desulfuromonadales bacterium]
MTNNLIEFEVIKNGIRKIRERAENGIKRITADFLVANFFEDIESMRKRGYRFEEILDELNIMLSEVVPDKLERDKLFAIKSGTLKVYMSRQRKIVAEATASAANEKQSRNKTVKKAKPDTSKLKEFEIITKAEAAPHASNSGNVPTGRAKATDLDREI